LGSLIASLPLSVLAFGPTDDPGGSFGWSQCKKSGSDPLSESAKGADFALMMSRPDGAMRLIVFQAKTDSSLNQREGTISLSQSRKDGIKRVFQIERLAAHADELLKHVSVSVKKKGRMFVHYLCQLDERGMGLRHTLRPLCRQSLDDRDLACLQKRDDRRAPTSAMTPPNPAMAATSSNA
jgi:hypothetical protein